MGHTVHVDPLREVELAARISAAGPVGDPSAEDELCRRFSRRIHLYGLRHLRDEASAADLVQQVLMLTIEKLRAGQVREPQRIGSFVLGTARMVAHQRRRQANKQDELPQRLGPEFASRFVPADPLDSARLEACMARLPARERSVVMLTYYGDQDAGQIANALGTSAGNVRVIRHRAVRALGTCLGVEELAS